MNTPIIIITVGTLCTIGIILFCLLMLAVLAYIIVEINWKNSEVEVTLPDGSKEIRHWID